MENLLKQILEELQEINKKIPAIESSSENDITGFSITTDTNELLVNVDFKSN